MKFVLFVEGQTERIAVKDFLKRWLDPRLKQPVGVQVVRFNGWSDLIGKMRTKARLYLTGPKEEEIIAVIALLDLYGPVDFYPGELAGPGQKYEWAVPHCEQIVDDKRFRMFFAVHELEAWLLSQPTVFPRDVGAFLAQKADDPESVNFETPPSKLLNQLYKKHTGRNYKKTTYGRQLFEKLDPEEAARKCPHLAEMLNKMLELAKQAGL